MFRLSRSACSAAAGRGRAAVIWGGVFLVLGQVGLDIGLQAGWPLRDPEFGLRLAALKARVAERGPAEPLVVFLGSSRVATTIRPGLFPEVRDAPGGPVVFNCALSGAGPIMELLTLRRLLADGVRPDCVFVEVWPAIAAGKASGQLCWTPPERLRYDDLAALRPYYETPEGPYRQWWKGQLAPWAVMRTRLLNQWAPAWVDETKRIDRTAWAGLDEWGWLAVPVFKTGGATCRGRIESNAKDYVSSANGFAPSGDSKRAYRDLFALCAREHITAALVAMPDAFLPLYAPAGRRGMEDFMREISKDAGVSLIDARDWSAPDDFFDGVHLTQDGAAAFTERFAREVLRPYLDGEPLARRRPPGAVHAAFPSAQWGEGFLDEEHAGNASWRWCAGKGEMTFDNSSDGPRRVSLKFRVRTPWAAAAKVHLESSFLSGEVSADMNGTVVDQIVDLPAGAPRLRFACDGPAYAEPVTQETGPRNLVFAIADFEMKEVGGTDPNRPYEHDNKSWAKRAPPGAAEESGER